VQLLLLATLIAAIGEPVLRGEGDMSQRIVILIDRSASMNTHDTDGDGPTRLDHAKHLAIDLVENMAGRREQGMAAVLAFGATAEVIQGFSRNSDVLQDALASIEPTDEEADFASALDLASSFTATADESGAASTELVIISDGGVMRAGEAGEARVTAASVRFVQASESSAPGSTSAPGAMWTTPRDASSSHAFSARSVIRSTPRSRCAAAAKSRSSAASPSRPRRTTRPAKLRSLSASMRRTARSSRWRTISGMCCAGCGQRRIARHPGAAPAADSARARRDCA
jgi:hypothetical protein